MYGKWNKTNLHCLCIDYTLPLFKEKKMVEVASWWGKLLSLAFWEFKAEFDLCCKKSVEYRKDIDWIQIHRSPW